MTCSLTHQQIQYASTALSQPGLIRLVSEIDAHGAIPPRAVAGTLTDLSPHQIRQAIEQANTLGLLDRSHGGIGLAPPGQALADLYDATARWARHHHYPSRFCDFAIRIRHTFALLAGKGADHSPGGGEAHAELADLHRFLAEWTAEHQLRSARSGYGAAA
ncbi:regulator [Streptomyces sp. NPDC001508]|uniref:regulator n=1 Tax=Streptomyces sp. NPDC001508 TaxID=3154656 RepID=UPI00332BABF8